MMYNYKERGPLLIILLLIFLIIDITNSQPSEVSRQESDQNLFPVQADSFTDGNLVIRLVKQSQLPSCYEPNLYLRVVKTDSNVISLNFNDIPQKNFCKSTSVTGTSFHKNNHNHCDKRKRWCNDDNSNDHDHDDNNGSNGGNGSNNGNNGGNGSNNGGNGGNG
ncbi:hypothetical protein C1645_870260, partial [Glomus cerebriforme]